VRATRAAGARAAANAFPHAAAELSWSELQSGDFKASFAAGYLWLQVAGGWCSDRVGGKALITVALFVSAGVYLALPHVSDHSTMCYLLTLQVRMMLVLLVLVLLLVVLALVGC